MFAGFVKDGKKLVFNGFQVFQEIVIIDLYTFIWNMIIIIVDIWEKWIQIFNLIIKE